MVVFICNACGNSIKKSRVEKHYQVECRGCTVLSCIDCGKDFVGDEYDAHNSCISEAEKYQGKLFTNSDRVKSNKGEKKQQAWLEKVQELEQTLSDPSLAPYLKMIAAYPNVPRKKAKFENFAHNSLKLHNPSLLAKLWDVFSKGQQQQQQQKVKMSKTATTATTATAAVTVAEDDCVAMETSVTEEENGQPNKEEVTSIEDAGGKKAKRKRRTKERDLEEEEEGVERKDSGVPAADSSKADEDQLPPSAKKLKKAKKAKRNSDLAGEEDPSSPPLEEQNETEKRLVVEASAQEEQETAGEEPLQQKKLKKKKRKSKSSKQEDASPEAHSDGEGGSSPTECMIQEVGNTADSSVAVEREPVVVYILDSTTDQETTSDEGRAVASKKIRADKKRKHGEREVQEDVDSRERNDSQADKTEEEEKESSPPAKKKKSKKAKKKCEPSSEQEEVSVGREVVSQQDTPDAATLRSSKKKRRSKGGLPDSGAEENADSKLVSSIASHLPPGAIGQHPPGVEQSPTGVEQSPKLEPAAAMAGKKKAKKSKKAKSLRAGEE